MTPTEDREIVEALAVKVMGWHHDPYTRFDIGWWLDSQGQSIIGVDSWNPLEIAEHSNALRDRLAELGWYWDLDLHPDTGLSFLLYRLDSDKDYCVEGESEFSAVALCALKAVGVEL